MNKAMEASNQPYPSAGFPPPDYAAPPPPPSYPSMNAYPSPHPAAPYPSQQHQVLTFSILIAFILFQFGMANQPHVPPPVEHIYETPPEIRPTQNFERDDGGSLLTQHYNCFDFRVSYAQISRTTKRSALNIWTKWRHWEWTRQSEYKHGNRQ